MDGGEHRSSQYGTPYQTPSGRRIGPGQPMGPPVDTRFSQPAQSSAQSDVARPSVARPYVPGYPYGYQDPQYAQMHSSSQMQGVEMQYTPTYVQGPSRAGHMQATPAQQQYPAYAQSSMLPPGAQQSMYREIQQYQQHHQQQQQHQPTRQQQQQQQPAAIEVMSSQFGGLPPYLQHGEHGAVGIGPGPSHFITTQPEQSPYGASAVTRPQLQPPFAPTTTEYQVLEHPVAQGDQGDDNNSEALEEARRHYEDQLKATFTSIAAGRISEAGDTLLPITRWLLTSVKALGLHHDDEGKHEQRLAFWREFNHAWEALGQKQKDVTEAALQSRRQPADVLSATTIIAMVDELIRLCDQVEKHGLVDYEMGVWEEQIIGIFMQCLSLLPQEEAKSEGSTAEGRKS